MKKNGKYKQYIKGATITSLLVNQCLVSPTTNLRWKGEEGKNARNLFNTKGATITSLLANQNLVSVSNNLR